MYILFPENISLFPLISWFVLYLILQAFPNQNATYIKMKTITKYLVGSSCGIVAKCVGQSTCTKVKCGLLLILYQSHGHLIPDKIKQEFFQALAMSVLLYGCTIWTKKKSKYELGGCFKQIPEAALYKTAVLWPLTSHFTNYCRKMSTCWALLKKRWTHKQCSLMDSDRWTHLMLANQQKFTFVNCVQTLGAI